VLQKQSNNKGCGGKTSKTESKQRNAHAVASFGHFKTHTHRTSDQHKNAIHTRVPIVCIFNLHKSFDLWKQSSVKQPTYFTSSQAVLLLLARLLLLKRRCVHVSHVNRSAARPRRWWRRRRRHVSPTAATLHPLHFRDSNADTRAVCGQLQCSRYKTMCCAALGMSASNEEKKGTKTQCL